jgi:hypothetical protein
MLFLFLLQSDDYERGYAMGQSIGQALAPCCCLGFVGLIGAGVVGGIVYLVRRNDAARAKSPPPGPFS